MNIPSIFRVTQGRTASLARQTPNLDGSIGGIYAGTETITATVWGADSQTALLTQAGAPNAWLAAATTQWVISFVDAQTATLSPGVYRLEVTAPTSAGNTGVLLEGQMEVLSSAGSTVATDLVTAYYAAKALVSSDFTNAQWEFLADAISAASKAIEKWCNRQFAQATYIEDLQPALDGFVRLKAIPVNQITRIQAQPDLALSISNGTAQIANVVYSYTGDVASGQVITGLTFTSTLNGIQTIQPVAYSANETVASVASAINGLGNGWTCSSNAGYGPWPATELIGGWVSQDATAPNGASLNVFSQGVANARFDDDDGQQTGLLWVGRQNAGIGPKWGPDYAAWDAGTPLQGLVRVTYNGGFITIPLVIQLACAELTKAILERLKIENYVESESGGEYRYSIALDQMNHLPRQVLTQLAQFRVHNA